MAILGVVVAIVGMLIFAAPASADPDPVTCTGYPEQRIPAESQEWWTKGADQDNPLPDIPLDGRDEHIHITTCLPAPGISVTGVVRFDLKWQLHETPDGYIKRIRIYSGSALTTWANPAMSSGCTSTLNMQSVTQPLCSGQAHCEGTLTRYVNFNSLGNGQREFRFQVESEVTRHDMGGGFATNGWTICDTTCSYEASVSGREIHYPDVRARGRWFETVIDVEPDYGYAISSLPGGWPADLFGLQTKSGTWCPIVRTLVGAGGEPVVRSFVSVDARWHDYTVPDYPDGWPGTILLDYPGTINQSVCVDTTLLSNGVHKLFIRADADTPSGMNAGVLIADFLVANP